MGKKDVLKVLWDICQPVAEGLGFSLYDVEYLKEGRDWFVRIYIDKPGGVNIDDCEAMSRKAEAVLDEKDPVEQAYILEVSSPGLDRALKKDAHFYEQKGNVVDVKLYKPKDGRKEFQGVLLGLENGVVRIEEDGCLHEFKREEIAIVRLAVLF